MPCSAREHAVSAPPSTSETGFPMVVCRVEMRSRADFGRASIH